MNTRSVVALAFVAFTASLYACGAKKPPSVPVIDVVEDAGAPAEALDAAPPPPPTLYERLGGKEGVDAVVDELLKNIAADNRVNKVFKNTKGERLEKFRAHVTDQVCELAGGPCKYDGKEMKPAHKGMAITEGQWDAFVEDLTVALQSRNIGEDDKAELLVTLARFKDDIVEKKKK